MSTFEVLHSPTGPTSLNESTKRKLLATISPVEDDSYFTHNPHPSQPTAPVTIMTLRPRTERPNLRVRFDHLLALDVPHADDRHPNDMYAHEKVSTPHPAQRILYRSCSTPPSRSSSWGDLMGLTPPIGCARSPNLSGDDSGCESGLNSACSTRRTHAPASGIARLLREDATLCASPSLLAHGDGVNIGFKQGHDYVHAQRARINDARGNSWVFDEAERLSFERARGGLPSSCSPSPNLNLSATIGALQMSRKRNGSERSLRSLLSIGSGNGSPTVEREGEGRVMRGVKRQNNGSGFGEELIRGGVDAAADVQGSCDANDDPATAANSTARRLADRAAAYAGHEQRMLVMRSQSSLN